MNNWPLFEQQYTPDKIPSVPGYQDTLVALLIVMLLAGSLLWGGYKRQSHKQGSSIRVIFSIYSIVQTIIIIGLLFANSLGTNSNFWLETAKGSLLGFGYFLLNTVLFYVSWFVFGTEEHIAQWFDKYFFAWGILGFALFIPLFISINDFGEEIFFLALITTIYLLFRLLLLVISISTFPKLRKYPLHIILYLCTCEIVPLLFFTV